MEALRGPEGLRRWTNEDLVPRPGDVFQERLYCIRWVSADGKRRYAAPNAQDLSRDSKALELLRDRFRRKPFSFALRFKPSVMPSAK